MSRIHSIMFAGLIACTATAGCGDVINQIPAPTNEETADTGETTEVVDPAAACRYGASITQDGFLPSNVPQQVARGQGLTIAYGQINTLCLGQRVFVKSITVRSSPNNGHLLAPRMWLGQVRYTSGPVDFDNAGLATWTWDNPVEVDESNGTTFNVNAATASTAEVGHYWVQIDSVELVDENGKQIEKLPFIGVFTFEITETGQPYCRGESCCTPFRGTVWSEELQGCVVDPNHNSEGGQCGDSVLHIERDNGGTNNGAYVPGDWAVWDFNLTADATEELHVSRILGRLDGGIHVLDTLGECKLIDRRIPVELQSTIHSGSEVVDFTARVEIPAGTTAAMQIRCLVLPTARTGSYTLSILNIVANPKGAACNVGTTGFYWEHVRVREQHQNCRRVQNGQTAKAWIDFMGEQRQSVQTGSVDVDGSTFEVHACVDNVEWRAIGFHFDRTAGNLDIRRSDGTGLLVNNGVAVGAAQVRKIGSWPMAPNTLSATHGTFNTLNGNAPINGVFNAGDWMRSRWRFDVQTINEMAEGTYRISFVSHGFFINGRLLSNDEVVFVNNAPDYLTVTSPAPPLPPMCFGQPSNIEVRPFGATVGRPGGTVTATLAFFGAMPQDVQVRNTTFRISGGPDVSSITRARLQSSNGTWISGWQTPVFTGTTIGDFQFPDQFLVRKDDVNTPQQETTLVRVVMEVRSVAPSSTYTLSLRGLLTNGIIDACDNGWFGVVNQPFDIRQ